MRVLILRPEPGNAATAAAVAAMGLDPVTIPLFEIVQCAWEAPDPAQFDAVVMTSANAARHGGDDLAIYRHLPLFAVGEATAGAAQAVGFADVQVGPGDAASLAPLLPARVLHLAGDEHRPLAASAKITVRHVYASQPREPSVALDADIALVHSPRAATRLAGLATSKAAMHLIAISPATATAAGPGWASVHIADVPREHAMLATLARVCEAARKGSAP